jgi:hypothetical protein
MRPVVDAMTDGEFTALSRRSKGAARDPTDPIGHNFAARPDRCLVAETLARCDG